MRIASVHEEGVRQRKAGLHQECEAVKCGLVAVIAVISRTKSYNALESEAGKWFRWLEMQELRLIYMTREPGNNMCVPASGSI